MGISAGTNVDHLSAAEADILRTFPGATITWDTKVSPYMVTIAIDGALVRAFIEADTLAQRGDLYEAFTRRVAELMADSMTAAERRAPLYGNGRGDGSRAPRLKS